MTEAATADTAVLGSNLGTPAVPPPPPVREKQYMMAPGDPFTYEQYTAVGWTDDQLIAAGKMVLAAPRIDPASIAPVGMPESKWIVLDDNDDIPPTGLFVGHNGTGYLIQTGVPVRVPVFVLQILDDAIMQAPVLDPETKQVKGWRPRPRYTYKAVPAPTDV